ncbi:MAG TPA: hypothetical protein VFO66_02510 [Gemmatimonadaceae bacterium]|nr:hypothetical protein [Gemmatimonadaceae bacterium]
MTDADGLWLATLQQVVDRAAHEVKDALNGVTLNVEVVRSRSGRVELPAAAIGPFAEAAASQLETLGRRVEALLVLCRPARNPADVALTLKHLSELLVPAAHADGGRLSVDGLTRTAPTSAPGTIVRLGLAAGLLAVSGKGRQGRCVLENGAETVVRFSHESAGACDLDPATAAALAGHAVRIERSPADLTLVFPGNS